MAIDYDLARETLKSRFSRAEAVLAGTATVRFAKDIEGDCDILFASSTQAYREVLVGCILARIQDRSINIRHPYVNLGPQSFNGRTLDEKAINPFLQENRIPSSRGPYLSVFRRSVTLEPRGELRDVAGYDALLRLIGEVEAATTDDQLHLLLDALLIRFAQLREQSQIPLNRLQRFSLEQYSNLVACLLQNQSGGRFPLFVVVAVLRALNRCFNLAWEIEYQGINVADRASGAVGDVTVKLNSALVVTAEITERRVDRARVVSTFNAKIGPAAAKDYLFFVTDEPQQEAKSRLIGILLKVTKSTLSRSRFGRGWFCQHWVKRDVRYSMWNSSRYWTPRMFQNQ